MNKLKIIKQQHKIKDKMIVLKDSAIDNKDELMAMLAQNVINDCDKIIEFCVKRIQLEMLEKDKPIIDLQQELQESEIYNQVVGYFNMYRM